MPVQYQFKHVRAQLDEVCHACGRDPREVLLVAVSKTVDADAVAQAMQAGACDFGENRPEQLLQKHEALPQANWHFIGNVQSRRIPDIVSCAELVHSVFKADHLPKIDAAARDAGKVQRILLEVNVSGEQTKGGASPADLDALLDQALSLEHVQVAGLMTMAPQGDIGQARACFAQLRVLRDAANQRLPEHARMTELSMGMSEDWQAAVAEGATIVRVGRAIFQEDFA